MPRTGAAQPCSWCRFSLVARQQTNDWRTADLAKDDANTNGCTNRCGPIQNPLTDMHFSAAASVVPNTSKSSPSPALGANDDDEDWSSIDKLVDDLDANGYLTARQETMPEPRWIAFELHDGTHALVIGARMHMAALVAAMRSSGRLMTSKARCRKFCLFNQATEDVDKLIRS